MSGLAGAVVWAVVPFTPQAPFRIYAGPGHDPFEMATARDLVAASRKGGDQQFTYMVPGKARPVLLLSDAHDDDLNEYLALRLSRFSKLTVAEQQSVRGQRHPLLFHLKPERFPGLQEENAAMIAGLVRLHSSAMDPTICGRVDDYELTTIHERFIRFHGLNVRGLVEERLRSIAAQQAKKRP